MFTCQIVLPDNSTTCIGFVHKSITVSCVGTCAQIKRCVVPCTYVWGQSGDGLCDALILRRNYRNNANVVNTVSGV